MGPASPPNLLTQADFDSYAGAWAKMITAASAPDLAALFQQATRLLVATLPAGQLLQLVSAIGVRRLKVGFVVVPAPPKDESAFTLALYATDEAGRRLSAYYLASTPWAATVATTSPPAPVPGCSDPVPPSLASLWQRQWAVATTIEAAFFQVPDGPLQGYDFAVRDFVDALLAVPQPDDKTLVFEFGLHELYGPDAPATPGLTRTFGLTTYLVDGHNELVSAPYDMAMPRPPAA